MESRFAPPNWHITINYAEDAVVTVTRTPNGKREFWRQPFPEERRNIPALDPPVDGLPLADEVIYWIAAILHHQSEEESVSKAESLDAMNTGHAADLSHEPAATGSMHARGRRVR